MKYLRHEEAVDNPYPYRVETLTARKTQASFRTNDGRTGFIEIKGFSDQAFIQYSVDFAQSPTGQGDQFRILATVFSILRRFMDKFTHVNFLSFFSYPKAEGAYLRLFRKYLPDFDVEVERKSSTEIKFSINRRQLSFPLEGKLTEQQITETFDHPYRYRIDFTGPYGREYSFHTDDRRRVRVDIGIKRWGDDAHAELEFSVDGKRDLTTQGDAFRIFATVIKIVKDFMNENLDVKSILFSSMGEEPSRLKVYERLVKRYAVGYDVHRPSSAYFRIERR